MIPPSFLDIQNTTDKAATVRKAAYISPVVLCIFAVTIQTASAGDLSHRSPDLHWPSAFLPERAEVFSHNEIDIKAPCSKVWNALLEAEDWPRWYSNCGKVEINGDSYLLGKNSDFEWRPFGAKTLSKVSEFTDASRLGWSCKGEGFYGYHNWLLIPTGPDSCHVVDEAVVNGNFTAEQREQGNSEQHRTNEMWVKGLKKICESNVPLPQRGKKPKVIPIVDVGPLTGR